jgi:hypothetical protein
MSRLQPRAKAVSTSNISSQSASANASTGTAQTIQDAAPKVGGPKSRSAPRQPSNDPTSDRSTLFLIRRTLCPNLAEKGQNTPAPIDEILPPLTSSNEVDLQLYAFIAIIIREFVHTWYTKITPDSVFVEEVVQIIAHCTRALEQRIRNVDIESLVFDELPDLLDVHVQGKMVIIDFNNLLILASVSHISQASQPVSARNKSSRDLPLIMAHARSFSSSRWGWRPTRSTTNEQ